MTRRPLSARRAPATSPFRRVEPVAASTAAFEVGARVTWDRCGMGRVVAVDADFVTVDFGEAGIRQLPAGTTGLHPL